jgi:DNA polymerase/3'-5' exonuclease PolX
MYLAFTGPNLYARLRCHDEAVFGALLKHFAGSPHRARMLNAASVSASPASAPAAGAVKARR